MKNDAPKPQHIVLLSPDGTPKPGTYQVHHAGPAGFSVNGLARTFWWGDEGKTWKRAEVSR